MNQLILLFAETAIIGKVKTRLASSVGTKMALWVYERLLAKTILVLNNIPYDIAVFYDPEVPATLFALENAKFHFSQQGSDLGERMNKAFQWGFDMGYKKICVIGTDLWEINSELIIKAFDELYNNDFVLGPASDGGYYLLGMTKPFPKLFLNMPWSSNTLLNQSKAILSEEKVSLLVEKNDIDTLDDLEANPALYKEYLMYFKS